MAISGNVPFRRLSTPTDGVRDFSKINNKKAEATTVFATLFKGCRIVAAITATPFLAVGGAVLGTMGGIILGAVIGSKVASRERQRAERGIDDNLFCFDTMLPIGPPVGAVVGAGFGYAEGGLGGLKLAAKISGVRSIEDAISDMIDQCDNELIKLLSR